MKTLKMIIESIGFIIGFVLLIFVGSIASELFEPGLAGYTEIDPFLRNPAVWIKLIAIIMADVIAWVAIDKAMEKKMGKIKYRGF